MEQYIPYSLICDLFSRNLESFTHIYTSIYIYIYIYTHILHITWTRVYNCTEKFAGRKRIIDNYGRGSLQRRLVHLQQSQIKKNIQINCLSLYITLRHYDTEGFKGEASTSFGHADEKTPICVATLGGYIFIYIYI